MWINISKIIRNSDSKYLSMLRFVGVTPVKNFTDAESTKCLVTMFNVLVIKAFISLLKWHKFQRL